MGLASKSRNFPLSAGRRLMTKTPRRLATSPASSPAPSARCTHHVRLALVVIASISLVGIVLVNALLVIPAATAKLLARSLRLRGQASGEPPETSPDQNVDRRRPGRRRQPHSRPSGPRSKVQCAGPRSAARRARRSAVAPASTLVPRPSRTTP